MEIPFSIPTVELTVPIPPAVCICAQDSELTGEKHLVMLPPGSPASVGQIASAYNSVLDGLNALKGALELISIALKPLKMVAETMGKIPTPYVTTTALVEDFSDQNEFDEEMSSFLIVGPTGCGVDFADTADPGDWDDYIGTHEHKKYFTIDILQLPNAGENGDYILKKLGYSLEVDKSKLSELANKVAELSGVNPSEARLGIGVFYVHDLEGDDTPNDLKYYDTDSDDPVQDDTESALWIFKA
ncbi:hypothetical protein CK936_16925 [Streptomyces albireticuli]|uniref:Uncharacterized protein n=1 Tax=Streptomyces albireticuli TaxID=1940 RepID=A0A2A2D8B4_9ACTN|nr:hypothetical protein CK936_16925 [Streptomyces albireticuli]